MILIDKEKLIEEVKKRKYSAASIKLIEEQPEVEAITIEWLLKTRDSYIKHECPMSAATVNELITLWGLYNGK